MKMITAYIRYEAFGPIREELLERGFPSMSITEVKGTGRQKGTTEQYRGSSMTSYLRPKLKFESAVEDKDVEEVVQVILAHAKFSSVGDGKVIVLDIGEAIRVRTGEFGEEVLQAHLGN